MHILMTFPISLGIPGGGPYAFLQTACYLKAAGAEVTVMPLHSIGLKTFLRRAVPPEKDGRDQIEKLHEAGVHVVPVPVTRLTFAFDGVSMFRAVSAYVRQKQVDAIISWHHEGVFMDKICKANNILFAFRASGNYELISHHSKGRLWSILTHQMIKRAAARADAIWASSDFTRKEATKFLDLNPDKVRVIPEGLNPIFQTARRQEGNEPVTRFFYFGAWAKAKGLFDALAAFGLVAAQGLEAWEFHIAGWGDEEKVWQTARQNAIIDKIQVLRNLNHPNLVKALEWSQVVILPSKIESFGLAVAEAQASGVPVIAYNGGAVAEIVEDGVTGWIAPINRVDLLAEAIKDSMNDPMKTYCMGLAGRAKIAGRFSWSGTAQQMLGELERMKENRCQFQ